MEWYRDVLRAKFASLRLPRRLLVEYKAKLNERIAELERMLTDGQAPGRIQVKKHLAELAQEAKARSRKTTQEFNPMGTSMKGIIHGKAIELDQEPGLPDGQQVAVTLQPLFPGTPAVAKEAGRDLPTWEGEVLGKLTREEIYDDRP